MSITGVTASRLNTATIRTVSRAPGRFARTSLASCAKSRTNRAERIASPTIVSAMSGV